jgi:hypothetical protein
MRVTEDIIKQVNAAMEKADGQASVAARAMGIIPARFYNMLHKHKELKLRWCKSETPQEAPDETVALNRPTLIPPPAEALEAGREKIDALTLVDDRSVAEAMDREDAAVRGGLAKMGVYGQTLELAMALQAFHKKHFTKAIEILGGGVTKQALDLMVEIQNITNTLNGDPNMAPAKEMMLREDRVRLLDLLGKFYDKASQAVLIQAKVKTMQGERDKPKKPKGFLAIQAQPGSTVNVSTPNESES